MPIKTIMLQNLQQASTQKSKQAGQKRFSTSSEENAVDSMGDRRSNTVISCHTTPIPHHQLSSRFLPHLSEFYREISISISIPTYLTIHFPRQIGLWLVREDQTDINLIFTVK